MTTPLLFAEHCGPKIGFGFRGTDALNMLFVKGVGLSSASDLLCLRSSRSKYKASATSQLLESLISLMVSVDVKPYYVYFSLALSLSLSLSAL